MAGPPTLSGMALGGWRWGGGGRKRSCHVDLCGAGLPPLLTKSLLGGGLSATRGLKQARSMPSGDGLPWARSRLARRRISSWPSSCAPWKGRGRGGTACLCPTMSTTLTGCIPCPTTASTTMMDHSFSVQGMQMGGICSSWWGGGSIRSPVRDGPTGQCAIMPVTRR